MKKYWLAMAVLLTAGCATMSDQAPMRTVTEVDLERYSGEWFVIANIPYFAERGNVAPRVEYRLRPDGRMDDLYFYRKSFDSPEQSKKGLAWVPDRSQPGIWKTRFYWPFTFDYLILKLDPEYRFVAIGHPSREYAWIMARQPTMAKSRYDEYIEALVQLGYQADSILRIPQHPDQVGQAGFQN